MRTLLLLVIFIISSNAEIMAGARENISLDQAVRQVKQKNNGRILSATTDRGTHNVRVLTPKGKVKRYRINERDGQYIRSQKRR